MRILTRFTDQILALRTPASQTIPGIHNSYPGRSVQEASITVYQRPPRPLVSPYLESALTTRTGTMYKNHLVTIDLFNK